MSISRLTFPAPRRCSDQTGITQAVRTGWKLTKRKGSQKQIDFELSTFEHVVDQPVFASRKWGEADVLRLISNGGWFDFNNVEFEDRATRGFAAQAQIAYQQIMEGV